MKITREAILAKHFKRGNLERPAEEILAKVQRMPYKHYLKLDKRWRDAQVRDEFKPVIDWIAKKLLKKGYNLETRYKKVEENLYTNRKFNKVLHYSITDIDHPERAKKDLIKHTRRIIGRIDLQNKKIDNCEMQNVLDSKQLLPFRNLFTVNKPIELLEENNDKK